MNQTATWLLEMLLCRWTPLNAIINNKSEWERKVNNWRRLALVILNRVSTGLCWHFGIHPADPWQRNRYIMQRCANWKAQSTLLQPHSFYLFFFTSPQSMSYISVPNTLVGNASFESKSIDAPSPLLRKDKKTSGGLKSAIDLLKALLLPIIAIAYLGFCYAVHYRTVPVNTYGIVNTSPSNLGRFPGTMRTTQ